MTEAGTPQIGKDGRLLLQRRERRYRLGVLSGQLEEIGEGGMRLVHHRFERLDEEYIAEKFLLLVKYDPNIHW